MESSVGGGDRLASAWRANRPGSTTPHVVVVLPAFSLSPSLLAHYATRLAAYEHRYLLATLMIPRIPGCELVFVSSEEPASEVLAYYDRLASPGRPGGLLDRLHVVTVDDRAARPVSAKLLDRPDLVGRIRELAAGRPVLVEPWNVTSTEVAVGVALGGPLNGTAPELWPLAFKSAGRRLFRAAGVPTPIGVEGVHTLEDVARAAAVIVRQRPEVASVVLKHDNSGAGDGNAVVHLLDGAGRRLSPDDLLASMVQVLPAWFVEDLADGGVVEELVTGRPLRSPSAQVDIRPDGSVIVVSTHEQVLGGANGQVYSGCSFPADPAYAPRVASHAEAVAELLAKEGARGRLSVDFLAARRHWGWDVVGLEVNLRKGGTTHPFSALRHLVPGSYDAAVGSYVTEDGGTRTYRSTDGLRDPAWAQLRPVQVIEAVARAGLEFDPVRRVGVVLHMLNGLAVDGRFGLTAIAPTASAADELASATRGAVARLV